MTGSGFDQGQEDSGRSGGELIKGNKNRKISNKEYRISNYEVISSSFCGSILDIRFSIFKQRREEYGHFILGILAVDRKMMNG